MATNPNNKENITDVRDRLYDRGFAPQQNKRTVLSRDENVPAAPRAWGNEPLTPMTPVSEDRELQNAMKKKKRRYRMFMLLGGSLFFLLATIISVVYLYLGGNTISNENIELAIDGPSSIGGGEVISLNIEVKNGNTAPLHSATLNVRFPNGTQSPDEEDRELLRETVSLETVQPGESVIIPVRAQLFGEEDEQKQIFAELEYRLQGSNGTFQVDTDPHVVKINSSPVSVSVVGVEQVSSGQPVTVDLVVRSNASTDLSGLLVKAEYPFGFDFISSDPAPVSGQNVWEVRKLAPGEEYTISVEGQVTGLPSDERVVRASVGVAENDTSYDLFSVFSADDLQYEIEEQFASINLEVNRQRGETVVINEGDTVSVDIDFANSLETTLYDAEIVVELSGTALREDQVKVNRGFYDSIRNSVIFDRTEVPALEVVQPADTVRLGFDIVPDSSVRQTPEINMVLSAKGRRVRETSVAETLIASESRMVKFASQAGMLSSVTYQSGQLPPVAEKLTQYTIALRVESGSNDLVDGEVAATLPNYVTWLDLSSGDGSVTFNPSSRTISWDVGDITNNDAATASFSVGFLPSISQVGKSPTLLSSQTFKAVDRFTGTTVRGSSGALTTRLSREAGFNDADGVVISGEDEIEIQ